MTKKISKKRYSLVIRIIIFLFALFYLMSMLDGYIEVIDGETTWTVGQIFRVVLSFIFAIASAYISCFTQEIDKRFNLGLNNTGRFLFWLFLFFAIFMIFIITTPAY